MTTNKPTKRVRTKEFCKDILLFWSGGADSTFLMLQDLLAGNAVTATYVDIINNVQKSDRERHARELLKKDISKFCKYFDCEEPKYIPDHSISVKGETFGNCPAPQQIIFAMFSMLIGLHFDEIHLGVVVGYCMAGSRFNRDIMEVCKQHFCGHFPRIEYPIESVSKETIYLALKGYDEVLGTHMVEHISCCESITEPCEEDKNCLPCKTQDEVLKRLKWR